MTEWANYDVVCEQPLSGCTRIGFRRGSRFWIARFGSPKGGNLAISFWGIPLDRAP
jgi:hypothetical protein